MYQRLLILSSLDPPGPRPRAAIRDAVYRPNCRMNCITLPMIMSANRKNTDVSVTITSTMAVVIQTSFQVGHVTFDVSWRTSSMK